MLKKFFGKKGTSSLTDQAQLEHLLAEIAIKMPQVDWIALVKSNGIFISSFPSKSEAEQDRISAMSAAMASLGERIASDLENGEIQYLLIAGVNGISVTIELGPRYLVTSRLKKEASLEEFLSQMQAIGIPLLTKTLQVGDIPRLSGIQQS